MLKAPNYYFTKFLVFQLKKKKIYLLVLGIGLFFSCQQDSRERLFEMVYPNITFELPAGLSNATPWAFEQESRSTNINFFLDNNAADTSVVEGILPLSARITSLDSGFGYDFVEEISVRICEEGRALCTPADEVFYIDDLRGRAGQSVDLLPSLRNARRDLVRNRYRLEIVFFFRLSTPYSVRSRLDMSFEAVR